MAGVRRGRVGLLRWWAGLAAALACDARLVTERGGLVTESGGLVADRGGPGDVLVRATAQLRRRLRSSTGGGAAGSGVPLTAATCDAAATMVGAMSCSMTLAASGVPEGCECRLAADSCPPPATSLGFTGLSPSMPMSLPEMGGGSVILCMYWRWLASPDRSAETFATKQEMQKATMDIINTAASQAAQSAAAATAHLWAMVTTTEMLMPTTPIPLEYFTRPPPIALN
mmetsp:Transcript_23764/g.68434  ORF Transcript_23764/g.68434 Transcript_23764/m.68434 type:complete len:228 (+) Transcript_23764:84-767(+)